ncbi:MAG: hypothetical protein EOO07_02700 [Chitinophagaceae bacterium]|nr:MAG: hypothetical protein EOO07_02700 [Chitinophagaceae bacterium]
MDIVSYLLELIETRKNVGVTALGTFFKKKTPGRYDSETSSFLPPKYELSFTSEVKENQELINFISEKRNISTESANYYINEFVDQIKGQLEDSHQADLSPIGQLKRSNDDIVLESSLAFGFPSFGLPSISTQPSEVAPEKTPESQPSEQEEQISLEETPDVSTIQEENEIEERIDIEEVSPQGPTDILDPLWRPTVINRYEYDEEEEEEERGGWFRFAVKATLAILLILTLIGAIIYVVYPDSYQTIKDKFTSSTPTPVETESIVMVDTNSSAKIDSPKADSSAVSTPVNTKDTIATPKAVNNVITYEIIGSAMKTQKKVDEVIANLAKRGITAKKMESMPGRLIKISLGTFTNYNQAKKFQDSLKIKLRNPELYIQTIKPKN